MMPTCTGMHLHKSNYTALFPSLQAMTHAVEAYVSTISNPLTDASSLHAIRLISTYLRRAVANGSDMQARDMMSYAQFLAGMAFNSASLGEWCTGELW